MPHYCIRHIPTGNILPCAFGRLDRGGSHVEPASIKEELPRLFSEKRYARGWLTVWLKGKHVKHSSYSYDGEYDECIEIIPQPHRKREEYEIAPIYFKIGKAAP